MFIVHVAALKTPKMTIHPLQAIQVIGGKSVQFTALQQEKAPTKIPPEYADYANVFLFSKLAIELPENTDINKHAVELKDGKQLPYGPIYSLDPVELKTFKTYIETHFKTGFI